MQGTIEPVHIIDWYDGVATAVATLSWRAGTHLVSLVGWSISRRRRAFAAIELSSDEVSWFAQIDDDENAYDRHVAAVRAAFVAPRRALVLVMDEANNAVISEHRSSAEQLRADVTVEVTDALDEARQHWLEGA